MRGFFLCNGHGRSGYSLRPSIGATKCAKHDRRFPMWVIHASDILELDELQPHQVLLAAGKLKEYEPGDGFVTFVSHEWSGRNHPDPENTQLRSLQRMLLAIRNNRMALASDTISLIRLGLTRSLSTKDLKKMSRGRVVLKPDMLDVWQSIVHNPALRIVQAGYGLTSPAFPRPAAASAQRSWQNSKDSSRRLGSGEDGGRFRSPLIDILSVF